MRIKLNITAKCQLEFDAATPKEAVKLLSDFQEVLSETQCGECKSQSIKFEHRNVNSNDYYSLRCQSCGAQLDFGQHKVGNTLFVKRDKGWYKYQKQSGESEYQ